jgi:hypothetical protein
MPTKCQNTNLDKPMPSLRNQQTKGVLHGYHVLLERFFGARKIIDCGFGFDDHDLAVGSGDENVWLKSAIRKRSLRS